MTIEQRMKQQLGELMFTILVQQSQIEELQAKANERGDAPKPQGETESNP